MVTKNIPHEMKWNRKLYIIHVQSLEGENKNEISHWIIYCNNVEYKSRFLCVCVCVWVTQNKPYLLIIVNRIESFEWSTIWINQEMTNT